MPNVASELTVDSSSHKVSTLDATSSAISSLEVTARVYSLTGASYRPFMDVDSTPDWTVVPTGVEVIFGNSGFPVSANKTLYITVMTDSDIEAVQIPLPSVTMTELYVSSGGTPPSSGQTYTYTVMKNGVATALIATISGTSEEAEDTGETVVFSAGDLFALRVVTSASAAQAYHSFGVKIA